ncbi:MAG TPA: DNA mismatch repair protein MutS, partial [Gemmatimonadaceae bacterium]|nr:DNA mismatch repair protein MutS [Gemmatimonadaceae bacterium]
MTATSQTPLMQQYREIKNRHQNAILFFRMGEFYEMFYDDAETASRVLGLTLTSRNNGGAADVPLAGVPVKAAPDYVRRLVQQGYRVAICEQVEDPRLAKGVVRREVIETVTPGVAWSDDLLDGARNNFIVAVCPAGVGERIGLAAADVSTGELRLIDSVASDLDPLMARLSPREILLAAGSRVALPASRHAALVTEREAWEFDGPLAREDLQRQFNVLSLAGLGVEDSDSHLVGAAGALLRYLRELQPSGLPQLTRPILERPGGVMALDEMTRRNLELVESLRGSGGGNEGTLLSVLDRTQTPMGARLLRQWILAPLTGGARATIESRLDAVAALFAEVATRESLRTAIARVRDVERLAAKAASGRSTPRELRALGDSLAALPTVGEALRAAGRSGRLSALVTDWDDAPELARDICSTLVERAPVAIGDDATILPAVDVELDELRGLRDGGKDAIARIQGDERARTGIPSLKVGFNKVFGYYIEISKSNLHLVPSDYQRRQTISSGERFVTQALKEYEERVLSAAERIEQRERELFEALRTRAGSEIGRLQRIARTIAELDVLCTFADVAAREGYSRPTISDEFALEITAGRHPVVERMMPRDKFIPNDLQLIEDARVMILTGPNMA